MTPDTFGSTVLLGLGLPQFLESLTSDPASIGVLALAFVAIGVVVVTNLPGRGGRK